MKIMSKLIDRFLQDLVIPDEIRGNLFKKRNNDQLKVFALSIPDLNYPDTYILAGRLLIYVNIKLCPKNIEDYVEILKDILRPEIKEFFLTHSEKINKEIEKSYYENFNNQNILSASANTLYLLRISHDEPPVETPCMGKLRQAVQFYFKDGIDRVFQCYYELVDQLYVHASPTMFNSGCMKNQLSSCFKGDTKLFTFNRGIINIKDAQLGDEVMTHKGNVKKVLQLHKNPLGERNMYKIKINRTFDIDVTDNHRFWSIQANGEKTPKWIPIEYLCVGDYIAIPPKDKNNKSYVIDMKENISDKYICKIDNGLMNVRTEFSSIDHLNGTGNLITRKKINSSIKEKWDSDEDWAFFLGAWYGDGNIMTGKSKNKTFSRGIRFVAHKDNYKIIERLSKIGEQKTGLIPKINKGTTYNKDLFYLDFHSGILGNYFESNYGKGFNGKKLDPRMRNWGGEELKAFICGLFSTDGCWTKQNKLLIQLSNSKLMTELFYLLRAKGVPVRYNFISKDRNKLATEDSVVIELPFDYLNVDEICKFYEDDRMLKKKNMKSSTRMKTINGQVFMRLEKKSISEIRPEFVYTIGVEDDHSYCIEGVVAENCFLITLGDDLADLLYTGVGDAGMISKLQGGLGMNANAIRHSTIGNSGKSGGILPFAEIYDKNTKCVNQGAKRNGAVTITVNDWHIDVEDFSRTRDNYTQNGVRFKSANIAVYLTNLFMERVKNNDKWTLFCPAKAKINGRKLLATYGPEFEEIYHLLEEEAPKHREEFNKFVKEISDMESMINSGEETSEDYIIEYHKKARKRVKMRKNLIEYKEIRAVDLYKLICDMNVKSGMPYVTYRDPANIKNNMMNIGVTEGFNLCLEITEPSTVNSIASCNLGHINLKRYVTRIRGIKLTRSTLKDYFNFKLMGDAMESLVENINKVIDYNFYPLDELDEFDKTKVVKQGKISKPNLANRPIGIGVSGLAEVFALLDIAFDSDMAKELNKMIFSCMYYHGLRKSHDLALVNGHYDSYRTGKSKVYSDGKWQEYDGSPLSNGFFQFDLWQAEGEYLESQGRIDKKVYKFEDNKPVEPTEWGEELGTWDSLREDVVIDGVYNSMILAPMPTASSAQMVRNAECFEAHQTLIYARKLVHGNITTFSEPFVEDMQENGLWIKEMIDFIQMDNGSIRYIHHFINDNLKYFKVIKWDNKFKEKVTHLQNIHRGMYEISQKDTMLLARQRGIYVDQSQSLNIYIAEPSKEQMMGVHAYSNALQLKTGMYYLRQNPASQTDRFTIPIEIKDYYGKLVERLKIRVIKKKKIECTEEVCIMCQ